MNKNFLNVNGIEEIIENPNNGTTTANLKITLNNSDLSYIITELLENYYETVYDFSSKESVVKQIIVKNKDVKVVNDQNDNIVLSKSKITDVITDAILKGDITFSDYNIDIRNIETVELCKTYLESK